LEAGEPTGSIRHGSRHAAESVPRVTSSSSWPRSTPPLPLLRGRSLHRLLRSWMPCRSSWRGRPGTSGAPTVRTRTGPPIAGARSHVQSGDPRRESPRPTRRHRPPGPARSSRPRTRAARQSARGRPRLANLEHHLIHYSSSFIPARRSRTRTALSWAHWSTWHRVFDSRNTRSAPSRGVMRQIAKVKFTSSSSTRRQVRGHGTRPWPVMVYTRTHQ
jgi:hypothetical protein